MLQNKVIPTRPKSWAYLSACFRRHKSLYRSDNDVERLTIPHKMMQKIDKIKLKQKRKVFKERQSGPAIISCKRKEFNHYKGKTYSNFTSQQMASGGWKHPKSKGDYFTINSTKSHPALELEDTDVTFTSLGINAKLVEALNNIGIIKPTNVQEKTIPSMLMGKNILCSAETGSGKTLAYLLPVLEKISKNLKLFGQDETLNSPAAVILIPSRELADQTQEVIQNLTKELPLQSICICGGRGTKKLWSTRPTQKTDILVATPGVLSKMLTNRLYSMHRLQSVVIDEIDTALDDSFGDLTKRIIAKMQVACEQFEVDGNAVSAGTQLALVGATMPRGIETILKDVVPMETVEHITTDYLHCIMPHIPQKFMRMSCEEKPEFLMNILKSKNKIQPTIIFCNNSPTSSFLKFFLDDMGISSTLLNSKIPRGLREGRFKEFQDGNYDVLICTDIASRGLDTVRAMHVINYEFPNFMSDYIHRAGRVGRVGSEGSGHVTSFIGHQKWEVDLLWKIESAARRTTELHNVNANIKRKLVALQEKKELAKIQI